MITSSLPEQSLHRRRPCWLFPNGLPCSVPILRTCEKTEFHPPITIVSPAIPNSGWSHHLPPEIWAWSYLVVSLTCTAVAAITWYFVKVFRTFQIEDPHRRQGPAKHSHCARFDRGILSANRLLDAWDLRLGVVLLSLPFLPLTLEDDQIEINYITEFCYHSMAPYKTTQVAR